MQRTFGSINMPVSNSGQSNTNVAELAKREGILEERERQITEKQKLIDEKLEQLEKVRKDLVSKLEKVSSMSKEEAKKILLENIDKELATEISKKIKEAEEEIKLHADEKAKEILADAMLHGVTDYISEFTTSKVKLPDEEMKGRIIGKEGRNVRTFEQVTGVDVVMDDEIPDTLILSSFDPIRREIAKVALEK
ncbi:MAG: Rnase Y domain-containing protein, partial [Candidatus Daviesbacteria bacterium]|nr:Rnase Y domain-containing protein [Candidatus Daviesbacteria bacterium]